MPHSEILQFFCCFICWLFFTSTLPFPNASQHAIRYFYFSCYCYFYLTSYLIQCIVWNQFYARWPSASVLCIRFFKPYCSFSEMCLFQIRDTTLVTLWTNAELGKSTCNRYYYTDCVPSTFDWFKPPRSLDPENLATSECDLITFNMSFFIFNFLACNAFMRLTTMVLMFRTSSTFEQWTRRLIVLLRVWHEYIRFDSNINTLVFYFFLDLIFVRIYQIKV